MGRPLGSRYVLEERLGRGGMGEVFRGRDLDGRDYAVKILHSGLAGDAAVVARFMQERSVLVGVDDPHLVMVRDLVAEGETLAIVMDLVRGPDLRRALAAVRTVPPAEVARLGAGVAHGLAAVHAAGVIHRDVKPENILLDTTCSPAAVRVSDFGIARLVGASAATRTAVLMGTPSYMAPELAAWTEAAPASDLYALGIVLYELSCGIPPFAGSSTAEVIRRHAQVVPGRPGGIPDPMWDLIRSLLDKERWRRPQSARQVAETLDEFACRFLGLPAASPITVPPPGSDVGLLSFEPSRADTSEALTLMAPAPAGVVVVPPRGSRIRPAVLAAFVAAVGAVAWALAGTSGGSSAAADLPRSVKALPANVLVLESAPAADAEHRLWTVDLDTAQERQLTTDASSDPVLSPDRRTVVYMHAEVDNTYAAWVMSADGLQQRRLLTATADRECDTARLAWHPGGDPERHADDLLALICKAAAPGGFELRVARLDGSPVRTLDRAESISEPTFSPDGATVTYAKPVAKGVDALFSVAVAPEGQPKQLTYPPAGSGDADAVFSPVDGRLIAFRRDFGGRDRRLYLYDLRSGATTQLLAHGPPNQQDPSWSPDGERLAFKAGGVADPAGDLWLVGRDGTNPRLVELTSGRGTSPAWTTR